MDFSTDTACDSQRAMVADRVRDFYEAEAKERQGTRTDIVENLPQSSSGKSRDKAAATVGVSGKLADAAKTVRTKGSKELQQAVESGEVSVSAGD